MNYCRSVAKRLSLIALYQFNPRITSLVYFFLFDRSQTEKKREMALYCTMCRLLL